MEQAPNPKVVFVVFCVENVGDDIISLEGIFESKQKAELYKEELEINPNNATGLKLRYFRFKIKEVEVK